MFGIPMLYGWIVGAVLLIATAGGSFYEGIQIEADHRDAQQVKVEQVAFTNYQTRTIALNGIGADLEHTLEDIRFATVTIREKASQVIAADPDIYSRQCIDSAGLQLLKDAIANTASADPGKPDDRLRVDIPAPRLNGSGSIQSVP